MKLNESCMNSVLFYLQNNLEFGEQIDCKQIVDDLSSEFSGRDLEYSFYKLAEAGYIDSPVELKIIAQGMGPRMYNAVAYDITLAGHERLNQITNG